MGTLSRGQFVQRFLQLRLRRLFIVRLMPTQDIVRAASAAMDLQKMYTCIKIWDNVDNIVI